MSPRALLLLFVVGCSSALPAPETTQHPLAAYVEVPYPPPAALAETVPPRPQRDGAVWIDGEWTPQGGAYVWRRGGWFVAPAQARFALWHTWYRRDGRLMMARGTWYDAKRQRLLPPEPIQPAATPTNELTSESQTGR